MSDVQRPTFEILCLMSNVHCPMHDVRRPMPDRILMSYVRSRCAMCDVRCAVSNVRTKNKTKNRTKIKTRNQKKKRTKKGPRDRQKFGRKIGQKIVQKIRETIGQKNGTRKPNITLSLGYTNLSSTAESISYEWAKRTSERYFQREKRKFVSPSGHEMFLLFYRYWWNS